VKTILIVAYFFPPEGGGGTQRAVKFAKYLRELGHRPLVLTGPLEASSVRGGDKFDRTLLADAEGVEVFRPGAGEPGAGSLEERVKRWGRSAVEAGARIGAEYPLDAILVTMSPFSLAHVGRALRRSARVPVIYDLRDPWTLDGWPLYRSVLDWWRDRRLMLRTLGEADGVVANTPEAGRCLRELLPQLDETRLRVIPNGYDAADFEGPLEPLDTDPARFHLVHTGTLHSKALYPPAGPVAALKRLVNYRAETIVRDGRTALHLLRAMRRLREGGHALAGELRLVLVGSRDALTERCVAESGVAGQVELTGYLEHRASVGWLRRADALFLPLHGLPPGARSRIVPGKAYEYLASGRPILGCLPAGDARELVERSGVGFVAEPCDEAAIAARLDELLRLRREGRLPGGPAPFVARYERRRLTEDLVEFVEAIGARRAASAA
jgi:glycosyltransferase involved in cell wall biosynthesis